MFRTLLLSFSLVVGVCGQALATDSRAEIDKAVQSLAKLYSDGLAVSYPEFRHIQLAKIFNSKLDDAVVLFALEGFHGGNAQAQYLAFFAAVEPESWPGLHQHKFRLVAIQQVGSRGWRSFDFETMKTKANSVQIGGKAWSESDAGCCPSLPISVTFSVKDGSITEAK